MNCTLCGNDGELVFTKKEYPILKCKSCGHLFTGQSVKSDDLISIYSDKYFYGGGDGYPDYTFEKDLLIRRGEYYAKKLNRITKQGKVLDVGSAAGFILKGFINQGWNGTGLEPNQTMTEYGKKVLGVNILRGSIETIQVEEKFELVTMIQVIAHLFNLKDAMLRISNILSEGGYLLIETWNKNSLTARISGNKWHEYRPPVTLNYFDRETLDQLVVKYGFSKVFSGIPKKSISGKHAKSIIKSRFENTSKMKFMSSIASIIPDNLVIPYPSEDLFWVLYKKQ